MAIATIQQLDEEYQRRTPRERNYLAVELARAAGQRFPWNSTPKVDYTPELAQRALAVLKDRWISHNLGKSVRPWQLVDITASLDPAQPWVGMEFETGFADSGSYSQAVEELWNNHNNNTMDGEGYGRFSAELTFAPVNLSDFNSGSYNIDRLLNQHNDWFLPYDKHYGTWGMHVNISTPAMRSSSNVAERVAMVLSASVADFMNYEEQEQVFGREPYGLFESRSDAVGGKYWIEGKLFCTTTDPEEWQEYKKRINNLIAVISRIEESNQSKVITNLAELLLADDVSQVEIVYGGTAYWPSDEDDYDYDEDY